MSNAHSTARRTALATSLAVVAATGIVAARTAVLHAKPAPSTTIEPSDRWLDGLKAKHRQLFDSPSPNGGIGLVHVMNYYDTYNKAYGVRDADVDAV